MRLIGSLVAWLFAAAVAYILAIALGQTLELNALAALGAPMPLDVRAGSIWRSLLGAYQYFGVILIGFAIAFYIANLVKAALPALSLIAYPTAGLLAIFVALKVMGVVFGSVPVPGGNQDLGVPAHLLAGLIGGVVFEMFRPKR